MRYRDVLESMKKRLIDARNKNDVAEINSIVYYLNNPKELTDEYYQQDTFTGYASIDKPHQKFFKKGTMEVSMPKMKMYDFLYERTKQHPNFVALNFYGRRITFAEFYDHVEEVAKSFLSKGIKKGDYVVIAMPTTPEAVYLLFALNRMGAVAVELDPRTGKEDLELTLKESKAKFFITMDDCSPIISGILESNDELNTQIKDVMFISPTQSLPYGLNVITKMKDEFDRLKGTKTKLPVGSKFINWHDFIKSGRNYVGVIDSKYEEGEVVEIIYSSGTTNTPKPILYTNETFTAMVRQIELGENAYAPRDKHLNIIPMYLGFGSNNALYTVLCFGIEDILIPVPVTDDLPKLIDRYKPNHILGAPIHMKILLNYLKANPTKMTDLSYLKSIVSGSGALESSKQYELDAVLNGRNCKIKVGPGYGQNEAGPGLSFSSDTFLELRKPGCSGYPLSATILSIFDPVTGEELRYGEDLEGELRYKTPCSMKGYAFNREQETSNFYRVGNDGTIWCCSGDLAKIDDDGGIYITGRITRQISRRNFKFCPTEVEELIVSNVRGVDSCVLVARPDEVEENVPVLYYTVKPEFEDLTGIIEEEIKTICNGLKDYKIPVEYIKRDSIPLTKNLKVDFKLLEKEAATSQTNRLIRELKRS